MGVSRNLNIFSFHFIQSFFPRRRLNHIMLMIGNQSTKTCSVQQRITNLVKFQKPPYFNMAFCQFESSLEALNTCFSICTARILQLCSRKKNILFLFFVYVLFFFTDIGLNLVISVTQLLHLFISNHRLNRIFSQLSHLSLSLSPTHKHNLDLLCQMFSHTQANCVELLSSHWSCTER